MANYWAERQAKTQARLTSKNIKETQEQLKRYYNKTMMNVISDFEATYDKLLATVADGREPTPADLYKLDKYWQMQGMLKKELQKLGDKQAAIMSKNFMEQYYNIYESFALQGGNAFNKVSKEAAQQMINQIWCADGKSWSQRIWNNTDKLQQALNDNLIDCVVTGKKTSDLKNQLQEQFNVSYNRADSLVRTEMAHIQTQAAQQRYKDYGIQEVEVWVDEDERTCPICAKHEGEKYPVNAKMPVPFHPRCRCCMIPVIDNNEIVMEDKNMKEEKNIFELDEKQQAQLDRAYAERLRTRSLIYSNNAAVDVLKKRIAEAQKALNGEKSIDNFIYEVGLGKWDIKQKKRIVPNNPELAVKQYLDRMRKELEEYKEKEEKYNYEVWTSFVYCVDCGKPILKDGKATNAVKRCPECQAKYRRKYKAEKEKERRKKKKNN